MYGPFAINCKPSSAWMCFSLIQFVMHCITRIESEPHMHWPGLWDKIHDGFNLIFACQQAMWLMIIHWPGTISYEAEERKNLHIRCDAIESFIKLVIYSLSVEIRRRRQEHGVHINGKIPIEIAISHILSRKFVSVNCQGNSVRSRAYDIDCIKLFW